MKGAFTGAVYPKKGLFELADKGSIFFDEIGNVPLETQPKLLRVMQEREFMRLGGVETIKVDVRIIAATNVDLRQMVEEQRFREDLYYRLHVITVQLPPLRERKEDIPLLVQHFLREVRGGEREARPRASPPRSLDLLMEYDWPGNVRELENVIERAVVLSTTDAIGPELVPDHVRRRPMFRMPQFTLPAGGHQVQRGDGGLRAAADRVHARGGRRRAEAGGRAAAPQAHHAERDDQALRHPPAQAKGRGRERRRAGGRG